MRSVLCGYPVYGKRTLLVQSVLWGYPMYWWYVKRTLLVQSVWIHYVWETYIIDAECIMWIPLVDIDDKISKQFVNRKGTLLMTSCNNNATDIFRSNLIFPIGSDNSFVCLL